MSSLPAPRGPYANGIRRKQQILEAASAVFARRGYANASMREIAQAVGVTPAALLRHFEDKEHLLLAVLEAWQAEEDSHELAPQGLAYFDGFPALMERHREHPGIIELFLTLCTETSDPDHPARDWVVARYARIVGEAVTALQAAAAAGEIRAMSPAECELEARMLFAVMDGLELQWIAAPDLDLGAMFRPVFEVTLARWRG